MLKFIGIKTKIIIVAAVVMVGVALFSATHPALADVTGSCLYTVQVGDELKDIAQSHNIGTLALYNQNKSVIGSSPDLIYPGEHLNVCLNGGGTTYKAASQAIPNPSTAPATYDIRQDIMSVFGSYGNQAIHIATCESGLNANAYNPIIVWVSGIETHAKGEFQIIDTTWAETPYHAYSPYNAWANVRAAQWIFAKDGDRWFEWSTWRCAVGY